MIAFTSTRDGNSEVYSVEPTGDAVTRLTTTAVDEIEPTWSRYGLEIVASRTSGATPAVVSVDREGSTPLAIGIKGSSADVRGPSEFQRWIDSLAKRSVRRAAAAARRYYVDNGTYDGITPLEMENREPELGYVSGSTDSSTSLEVSISEQDTVFTAGRVLGDRRVLRDPGDRQCPDVLLRRYSSYRWMVGRRRRGGRRRLPILALQLTWSDTRRVAGARVTSC